MNRASSYADHVTEWNTLLGNVANETSLAGLVNQPKLQAVLDRLQSLLVQQSERQAAKQVASQEIKALILAGRDLERDLKIEIKAKLGSRSEQLVQFKLKPLRPSPRLSRTKAAKPALTPEPVAPAPNATA